MKTSEALRRASGMVDLGRRGLFMAPVGIVHFELLDETHDAIAAVLPKRKGNAYGFAPADLPQAHRATILALAAAIAESEGK